MKNKWNAEFGDFLGTANDVILVHSFCLFIYFLVSVGLETKWPNALIKKCLIIRNGFFWVYRLCMRCTHGLYRKDVCAGKFCDFVEYTHPANEWQSRWEHRAHTKAPEPFGSV